MADENKKPRPHSDPTPPPLDPFPTYQSSFPRPKQSTEDDNPFIQFRRFADQQFSSLFQSLGIDFSDWSSRAHTEADIWVREWQRENDEMCRRRQKLEEGFKKQIEQEQEEGWRHAEDVGRQKQIKEGLKKQWEQEKEERIRGLEDAERLVKDVMMSLHGALPFAELGASMPKEATTELDLYEDGVRPGRDRRWGWGASCQRRGPEKVEGQQQEPTKKKSEWFTLGYDGRQRLSSKEDIAKEHDKLMKRAVPYSTKSTRRLDPFGNPDHTLPWLLINPYSPLCVSNPSSERLVGAFFAQSPHGTLNVLRPWYVQRTATAVDEHMARKLPWADAFEDLVSLENTGKMQERNYSTWRTPDDWILGMAARGSLRGWDVNEEGSMVRNKEIGSRNGRDKKLECRRNKEERQRQETEKLANEVEHAAAMASTTSSSYPAAWYESEPGTVVEIELWPLADAVTDAIQQAQETQRDDTPLPMEQDIKPIDSTPVNSTKDFFSSSSSSSWSRSGRESDEADSVVSTLTTTERKTRPDGSVETKRVLKKKFADGREESTESVERENATRQPNKHSSSQGEPKMIEWPKQIGPTASIANKKMQIDPEDGRKPEKVERKGGWFWT